MEMSLIQACRSLALSTWLLSFCFVHLVCLDFTVAEKEEWYTAFVNITYAEPAPDSGAGAAGGGAPAELHSEKSECGRYGEHSPKQDARGEVVMASSAHDRLACDPNTKFAAPAHGKNWIALIPKGNCTYRDKIRNAFLQNASAVVIFNVGSNTNETITMPHAGLLMLALATANLLKSGTYLISKLQWGEHDGGVFETGFTLVSNCIDGLKVKSLSRVRLLATPWTAAHQAPLFGGAVRLFSKETLSHVSPRSVGAVQLLSILSSAGPALILAILVAVKDCLHCHFPLHVPDD
ncbi:hypothetical protein FD755_017947 [Muntiacus reevesi]|uniref:PA domain-containing protein n=1 Tax=Muntiacus reevesi TaxID=9886 RepID=A0A5N3X8E4_MUNRE|nr:hypothetical protein FD755_017947 [Muntiacus reevesi]